MSKNSSYLVRRWGNFLSASAEPAHNALAAIVLENLYNEDLFIDPNRIGKLLVETPYTTTGDGVRAGLDVRTNPNPANPAPNPANLGDGSAISGYDTVTISMVKRLIPQLIAFDMVGIQPMNGPAGVIFADRWTDENGLDWLNPQNPRTNTIDPLANAAQNSNPILTNPGELANSNPTWKDIVLKISRMSCVAETRLFKANLTDEVVQDLLSVHNIDSKVRFAEAFLQVLLHTINRETTDMIKAAAITTGSLALGAYSDIEYHKFFFRLERMAEQIAADTGKTRGNFVLCSPRVAAYLTSWGHYLAPVGRGDLEGYDLVGSANNHAYIGTLTNNIKIYADYTATTDYMLVGAKGSNPYDAGMFFCPYTLGEKPFVTRDPDTFQPIMYTRARYGFLPNPHATGFDANVPSTILNAGTNRYFRILSITGLTDNPT